MGADNWYSLLLNIKVNHLGDEEESSMNPKVKKVMAFTIMGMMFVLVIWGMFQPLMSSYLDEGLEKGSIYVYGISFLNEFGSQGILTVAFPFLLMLILDLDIEGNRKAWICKVLTFVSLLSYVRSLTYARRWLCTEISWVFEYHMGIALYPALMIAFAAVIMFGIYKYDEVENEFEEEEIGG